MKIFKTTFVFILFFFCVCTLSAQVMESVAYTPSKTGRYGTLTTRSIALFSSDLEVTDGVVGLGEKLTFDSATYSSTSGTTLSAERDIYSAVTAAPTSAYISGTLDTNKNVTYSELINSPQAVVYGGDTNFSNSKIAINKRGTFEIDNVKMKNPKCDIKWMKLNAFTSSTPPDESSGTYWFAYCDSDTNATPDDNEWSATISTINALGTCLSHSGACVEDTTSNTSLFKKYFTCDNIAVYQCTSGYSTRDEFASYKNAISNPHDLWVNELNSGRGNGWCAGAMRRYPATRVKYGGDVSELVPIPVDSGRDRCGYSSRTLEAYCGLELQRSGTTSSHYRSYAQDAYYKMKHNDICTYSTQKLTLCHELGNYSYNEWVTVMADYNNHTHSTEDLCNSIAERSGSTMSSFSCVMDVPSPTSFTYYKSAKTVITEKSYYRCKNGHCYSDGGAYLNGDQLWAEGEYCRQREGPYNYRVEDYPTGYVTATGEGYPNAYWAAIQGEYGKVGISGYVTNPNSTQNTYCPYGEAPSLPPFGGYTYRTHYLNKKMQNTSILNCSKDQ